MVLDSFLIIHCNYFVLYHQLSLSITFNFILCFVSSHLYPYMQEHASTFLFLKMYLFEIENEREETDMSSVCWFTLVARAGEAKVKTQELCLGFLYE